MIKLNEIIDKKNLINILKKVECKGVFKEEIPVKPYENATFKLAKILPSNKIGEFPKIVTGKKENNLYTSQPTIYLNQLNIIEKVDGFLKTINKRVSNLEFEGVGYNFKDKGNFHILPPIVEKHTYYIKDGFLDIKHLRDNLKSYTFLDAKNNHHKIYNRYLENFYIDEVSKIKHLDVFNDNLGIINYGKNINGKIDFYIVCDGSHRIDYSLETLKKPTNCILVENLNVPYYAMPQPFYPMVRISSKIAEQMYSKLTIDKIHLFNYYFKKALHYNWVGLSVSKLRNNL